MTTPSSVKVTRDIAAPANHVWQTVRDFAGITKFLPMFELVGTCENKVGALRTLKQGDAIFVERLEALDEANRLQRYTIIEAPVPMKNYLGEISVQDLGNNRCAITWSSTFTVEGAPESEVVNMVTGLYNAGIDQIEKLHG